MFNGGYDSDNSSEDLPLTTLLSDNSENSQYDLSYDCLIQAYEVSCDFCDKVFTNRYEALKHTKSHIIIPLLRPTLIRCHICLCYFTTEEEYQNHQRQRHVFSLKSRIKFESDDEDFETENSIQLNNLHNIGCYRCKYCHMIFSTRYNLLIHNLEHIKITPPKLFLCAICEGFYEDKTKLKHHVIHAHNNMAMPNNILNKCLKCNLIYNNYHTHVIKYHLSYACYLCHLPFFDEKSLSQHLEKHNKKVKCQKCQKKIISSEMNSHDERLHSTMKICDTCLLFVKRQRVYNCISVGEYSVASKRCVCDLCRKKFLRLNIVRRFRIRPLKFKEKRNSHKSVTNADRLKNIRDRLKKINLLNKY